MNSFSQIVPNLGKSPFAFSSGDIARQAGGGVVVSYGDTVVLVTVCASKEASPAGGFLPLTVDYQAKTYAMGKIPGGYIKKEGRPKDTEILTSRLIDRPLRPLFPKGFTNGVQIIALVLSSDKENDPDILALNGASCALAISDIPFPQLVGAVRVASVNGKMLVNPTYEEREQSPFEIIVVGTKEKIVMIEGQFQEASEEEILAAVEFAHPFIKEIVKGQEQCREKIGKEKKEYPVFSSSEDLKKMVIEFIGTRMEDNYAQAQTKEGQACSIDDIIAETFAYITEEKEIEAGMGEIKNIVYDLEEKLVRSKILNEGKRPDGRPIDQVRPLSSNVSVLPRTHGSAVFTRGQTQSLAITTLGTSSDEQTVEALEGVQSKHFMLHYSFPPFSVGDVRFMRGPSRREIGHGALAEKAIQNVLPSKEDFPYTIRVVSEILESNGSSSMATVCATSLSLMDAGVPISKPVAGIAIGLVTEGDKYKILTDIAGAEDHYGDMDFKVAGTENGVCAMQVDVKIDGLTSDLIKEALERAKQARLHILNAMKEELAEPRVSLSQYAPKIKAFKVDPSKIGEIIGPGGRMIRKITSRFNVNIDIDDETATVSIVAESEDDLNKAVEVVQGLVKEPEVGEIYDAEVVKIMNFGAFCDFLTNKSGLVHVSEISNEYVKEVRDVLKEGDKVRVKVIAVDPQGKINLSIKQAE